MVQQGDWERAARLIVPRSRFGWLFGVTKRDIDKAVAKLSRADKA